MSDSADDKPHNKIRQAQPIALPHDELRKRLKVYPTGPQKDGESDDLLQDLDIPEHAQVDGQIRGLYKELLEAPIPQRMLELVRKLADKERQ